MPALDVNRLVSALTPTGRIGLEQGASIAARNSHQAVEVAHWLRALSDLPDASTVFETAGINLEALRRELDLAIEDMARGDGSSLALAPNTITLAREAWLVTSLQFGRSSVDVGDILIALLTDSSLRLNARAIAPSLRSADLGAVEAYLRNLAADAPASSAASGDSDGRPALGSTVGDDEFLRLYTQDLTAEARAGRIDPVIGRDLELRQVIDVLMRRRQNNPILVGEAGVGKTAIAEAMALAVAAGEVPDRFADVRLLSLDLSLLQAGAGVKGEFERRLHGVVDAVKKSPQPVILFIDEAHSLIGAGGQAGQGDAANILKPSLARGELRTIAATTWSEYKRFIEKDAALTRRFQVVKVEEPDEETAIRMLRGVADVLTEHHGVRIRDEALSAAVKLSARYIPSRQLPDKAISLLDTAAASVALARQAPPEMLKSLRSEQSLLKIEEEWLEREPSTPENRAQLDAVVERRKEIAAQIDELGARYDEAVRLVNEADRIEAIFSRQPGSADDGQVDAAAAESDTGNVTAFPQGDVATARAALALAEKNIAASSGETPLVPRVVDREVVAALVARWTGIPVGKLLSDQVEAVRTLDERLKQRVIGQDAAIGRIADAMRAARAGLSDPRRPPAVFLLVGMSGTGKTETALALADQLYGGPQHLTTINMSEFKEEHKISMLLGSPPGYVGYGEGGVLTEAVRRRPYGVLLLDEIDKAHQGVQEIFYQVFDKGMLRDGEGRDIDFKNTTILMTANSGSELLASLAADPETMPEGEALEKMLHPELQKQFKPAFLGRTTILPFMPLGEEALSGIVDIQIGRIADRVSVSYGTTLTLSQDARNALVARAQTSEMGARAIETMIARDLLPVISGFFLDAVTAGRKVASVVMGFDEGTFTVASTDAPAEEEFAASDETGEANNASSKGGYLPSEDASERKAKAP